MTATPTAICHSFFFLCYRFQGDEADIIILSLVRTERLTEFIRREDRMCVALSRARFGLFILGMPLVPALCHPDNPEVAQERQVQSVAGA